MRILVLTCKGSLAHATWTSNGRGPPAAPSRETFPKALKKGRLSRLWTDLLQIPASRRCLGHTVGNESHTLCCARVYSRQTTENAAFASMSPAKPRDHSSMRVGSVGCGSS